MQILLADDHALIRAGLEYVLKRLSKNVDIHQAENFTIARDLIENNSDWDLILLDLTMPGTKDLDGLEEMRNRLPMTPIVVLSANENPRTVQAAIALGANGYITKSATNKVMLSALKLVMSGGIYLPPIVLKKADSSHPREPTSGTDINNCTSADIKLTPRQREVLALLADGLTNKEIGRALTLSEATIRTHVTAIFRALGVSNRTQAGRMAIERNLID